MIHSQLAKTFLGAGSYSSASRARDPKSPADRISQWSATPTQLLSFSRTYQTYPATGSETSTPLITQNFEPSQSSSVAAPSKYDVPMQDKWSPSPTDW